MEWFHQIIYMRYKIRVADLMELLSHADQDAEVRYSVLSFSEYGEVVKDDGAGRLMSRKQAKNSIAMDDFKHSMEGVFTTSVNESTLDESPMAYKPAEEIIELVKDTVDVAEVIKPIYNFKASE